MDGLHGLPGLKFGGGQDIGQLAVVMQCVVRFPVRDDEADVGIGEVGIGERVAVGVRDDDGGGRGGACGFPAGRLQHVAPSAGGEDEGWGLGGANAACLGR